VPGYPTSTSGSESWMVLLCIICMSNTKNNARISTQSFKLCYHLGGGVLGVYFFFLEYSPALFNILYILFLEVGQ
jgi:uncharacterized membrane protein YdcZ (DUF606 family)